jgi:hypothetical protein
VQYIKPKKAIYIGANGGIYIYDNKASINVEMNECEITLKIEQDLSKSREDLKKDVHWKTQLTFTLPTDIETFNQDGMHYTASVVKAKGFVRNYWYDENGKYRYHDWINLSNDDWHNSISVDHGSSFNDLKSKIDNVADFIIVENSEKNILSCNSYYLI